MPDVRQGGRSPVLLQVAEGFVHFCSRHVVQLDLAQVGAHEFGEGLAGAQTAERQRRRFFALELAHQRLGLLRHGGIHRQRERSDLYTMTCTITTVAESTPEYTRKGEGEKISQEFGQAARGKLDDIFGS